MVVRDLTAPSPNAVAELSTAFAELTAKCPGGVTLLYITGPSDKGELPDEASRNAVLQALREHKTHIRAIGYVILLRGILAATMRSVGSALLYAARIPFPTRIFADLDEGVGWIVDVTRQAGAPSPDPTTLKETATAILDRLQDDPCPG